MQLVTERDCFLAALNLKYALYSSQMGLCVQIKALMLCSYRNYILTLGANSLEQLTVSCGTVVCRLFHEATSHWLQRPNEH